MEKSRLEAFSDGVFAIAITLLVLEIVVPHIEEHGDLGQALLDLWPSYLAYATSFLTIGIMWINHHTVFRQLGEVDHRFLFINLGLLMCISFVPFPTTLLADYAWGGERYRGGAGLRDHAHHHGALLQLALALRGLEQPPDQA